MKKTTWVILGATSIIAEKFALLAATKGCSLLLIGREHQQLIIIANDIKLRHGIQCETLEAHFENDCRPLFTALMQRKDNLSLFIAYSYLIDNEKLTLDTIAHLVKVNLLSTLQLVHSYWKKPQDQHRIIFLSSVAGCRGRAKNSLYGASKKAIVTYLEGLQQEASNSKIITIVHLGFIDTIQTFGRSPFAAPPTQCAIACWQANDKGKRQIYFPFFWRYVMLIIRNLPFFIYQKLKKL